MQLVEQKVCSILKVIIHLLRKFIAATETRIVTMKRHCLLFSGPALLNYLLYTGQTLLGVETAHSGLDPPTSISSQENVLETRLLANLVEAISQLRFSHPK